MITEDYVSVEIAKLLKEKGFDGIATNSYDNYTLEFLPHCAKHSGQTNAPTLQIAMKWLREVHHLFIAIHPRLSFTDYYWITADIYRAKRKSSLYHTEDVDDYNCIACCDETSFEKACEVAIRYCLENLI